MLRSCSVTGFLPTDEDPAIIHLTSVEKVKDVPEICDAYMSTVVSMALLA